jgi:chromate reductase, NAD(P)H dehydrogenase (quinone)
MKILLLAASLRKDSFNKKLIAVVGHLLPADFEIEMLDFNLYQAPSYHGDLEVASGVPSQALTFGEKLKSAGAIIIASPEYNFSTPGTLKNLIDWVSRLRPMPWVNKPIFLISASPSLSGGKSGLLATSLTLEACNAYVFPEKFFLSSADQAFSDNGDFKDAKLKENLNKVLGRFLSYVKKFM